MPDLQSSSDIKYLTDYYFHLTQQPFTQIEYIQKLNSTFFQDFLDLTFFSQRLTVFFQVLENKQVALILSLSPSYSIPISVLGKSAGSCWCFVMAFISISAP